MRANFAYFLIFFMVLVLDSCIHKPVYPSQPVIAYKDFIRYGNPANPTTAELVVSFTDNEGDISLPNKEPSLCMVYFYWDTTGVDHWSAYDMHSGIGTFDTLKFCLWVPQVLPNGDSSEPMKGLIYAKLDPFIKLHNRIKYVVYLKDQAGHTSDTIHTPAFTFP